MANHHFFWEIAWKLVDFPASYAVLLEGIRPNLDLWIQILFEKNSNDLNDLFDLKKFGMT